MNRDRLIEAVAKSLVESSHEGQQGIIRKMSELLCIMMVVHTMDAAKNDHVPDAKAYLEEILADFRENALKNGELNCILNEVPWASMNENNRQMYEEIMKELHEG